MQKSDNQEWMERHPSSLGLPADISWLTTESRFSSIVIASLGDMDNISTDVLPFEDESDCILPDYTLEESFPKIPIKAILAGSAVAGAMVAIAYFNL